MTVIVADLGCLRAFRVVTNVDTLGDENPALQEIDVPISPVSPKRISDSLSDQAGRFQSDGSPGMARGEAHGLKQEQERRNLTDLASAIDQVLDGGGKWALAAPKAFNARLVDMLDKDVRSRLGENLLADLCKQPILEIQKRFKLAVA